MRAIRVTALMEACSLSVELGGVRRWLRRSISPVRAVSDVSLQLYHREILAVVGESGCGKTTLGRTLLGLQREASGDILLEGKRVSGLAPERARRQRGIVQYVHQDAGAALDPWWSIGATLAEGLRIRRTGNAGQRREQVDASLLAVGLPPDARRRYPHEFSGGQLRRVALARILLLKPTVLILDEPTSGLDMSVQATVLNLLLDLRERLGLSYLFISHDLSVVERLSDRVAIMYLGRIVETAPTRELFAKPTHPYTKALLQAAPRLNGREGAKVIVLQGDPPSHAAMPAGCAFASRCPIAVPDCARTPPALQPVAPGHDVACHLAPQTTDLVSKGSKSWTSAFSYP